MIIVAVCTEGKNSEPNYIRALKSVLFGTSARSSLNIEVVGVPLGGNQGHRKIFEKADEELEKCKANDQSILSVVGSEDSLEKWIVVDYDKMEKNGISESEFRQEAVEFGYKLIINKPNFEFFVLCHFMSVKDASKIPTKDLKKMIDERIKEYNIEHGFDKAERTALHLPRYSKGKNVSEELFWKLLDQNPELIDSLSKEDACVAEDKYSEMWKIIKKMIDNS